MAPNSQLQKVKVSEKTAERTEKFSIRIGDVLAEGYVGRHVGTKYEALLELAKHSNGMLQLDEKGENRKYVSEIRIIQDGMTVAKVNEDGYGGLQFYENNGLGAVVDRNGVVFFLGLDQMKFKGGDLMTGQYDPYTKDIMMLASSVIRNVAGFHNAASVPEEKIRDLSTSVFGEYMALTSDFIAANNMILEKNLPKNDQFRNMFSVNTELCRVAFEYSQGARGREFAEIMKWDSVGGGAIIQNGFGSGFVHEISGEMERKSLPEISYWKKVRRYNRATAKALGITCFPAEEPVFYGGGVPVQSRQKTVACASNAPEQKETPENERGFGFSRNNFRRSGQNKRKYFSGDEPKLFLSGVAGTGKKKKEKTDKQAELAKLDGEKRRRRKKTKETGDGNNRRKTTNGKPELKEGVRKTKKKEQELLKKENEGFEKNVKKKENESLKASESKTRNSEWKTAANEQKLGKKTGPKGFLGGKFFKKKMPEPLTYGLRVRRSGQAELRARKKEIGNNLSEPDKGSKVILLTKRNKKSCGSARQPAANWLAVYRIRHSPFAAGKIEKPEPEKITERKKTLRLIGFSTSFSRSPRAGRRAA